MDFTEGTAFDSVVSYVSYRSEEHHGLRWGVRCAELHGHNFRIFSRAVTCFLCHFIDCYCVVFNTTNINSDVSARFELCNMRSTL